MYIKGTCIQVEVEWFVDEKYKNPKSMNTSASKKDDETADIDPKTKAVFAKKGYEITKKLGAGAFGQVYKGRNLKSNMECAVKVMNMGLMSRRVCDVFLPRELSALMEVKHPNAIRVYDIIRSNHRIYIFMEYAGNGDIAGYLKRNKKITEKLASIWFTQTCEAVYYLHNNCHMAHRDIKLDNILLDAKYNCKLTDFGFANLSYEADIDSAVSETYCGTVPYYSPLLAAKQPYNPFKADVWALGVVMYAMLNNRFPFHFQDVKQLQREQNNYPEYIGSRFSPTMTKVTKDLLLKIFDPDDNRRPTVADILKHEWVVSAKCLEEKSMKLATAALQ